MHHPTHIIIYISLYCFAVGFCLFFVCFSCFGVCFFVVVLFCFLLCVFFVCFFFLGGGGKCCLGFLGFFFSVIIL